MPPQDSRIQQLHGHNMCSGAARTCARGKTVDPRSTREISRYLPDECVSEKEENVKTLVSDSEVSEPWIRPLDPTWPGP